jgi:hypothetical protein
MLAAERSLKYYVLRLWYYKLKNKLLEFILSVNEMVGESPVY